MLLTLAKLRLFFETTKHFIKKVQTAAAIRTWYVTKAHGLYSSRRQVLGYTQMPVHATISMCPYFW